MTTINIKFNVIINDDGKATITAPVPETPMELQAYSKICKALADAEGEINTSFFINKLFSNSNSDEKVQRNKDCHGGADDKE